MYKIGSFFEKGQPHDGMHETARIGPALPCAFLIDSNLQNTSPSSCL